MFAPASKIAHLTLEANQEVSNTGLWIHHILVCNATADDHEVIFRDNDDIEILSISAKSFRSTPYKTVFFADNGLKIDSVSDIDVSVTISYSGLSNQR